MKCFSCGGPVERRFLKNCWNLDGSVSHEDCGEGYFCQRCGVFWTEVLAKKGGLCRLDDIGHEKALAKALTA